MTPPPPGSCDVLVVGAGISGLVAAARVRAAAPNLAVRVIDVAAYAGGKLLVGEVGGVSIDLGAESMIARRPEGLALVDELELTPQLRYPSAAGARVAIDAHVATLPQDTVMGVPGQVDSVADSGLLSAAGLARLRAPVIPDSLPDDASITDVIGAQLGDEVVDRMVEPLLAGVYAGRADRLSLRATVPGLWRELGPDRDVMAAVRRSRASAPAAEGPVFASLAGGIGSLPGVLVERFGLSVHLRTPARSIQRTPEGFEVGIGAVPDRQSIRARTVILALPVAKAAQLLAPISPGASDELAAIDTATVAVVALAYRREPGQPTGSGLLVPVSLGRAVKAVTYLSNKWPHLSDDIFLVRASVGRVGEDRALQVDDEALVNVVRADLHALTGLTGEPIDRRVQRWAGSLPQYNVGHLARVDSIRRSVAAVPGLAVAGSAYDGVGIPGCINSATSAAQHALTHLVHLGRTPAP